MSSKSINLFKSNMVLPFRNLVKVAFSNRYLFYTNVTISFSLSGVGDVIMQNYEILNGEKKNLDTTRLKNMTLSGVTVGVLCHHWYKFLDAKLPGNTIKQVMKKVVFDQFMFSPVMIGTFLCTLAILEGTTREELVEEVKQKGWRLYVAEWVIWPPAQFINFYFLPTRFRVLYDSTISLAYDVYYSYVKNDLPLDKSSISR